MGIFMNDNPNTQPGSRLLPLLLIVIGLLLMAGVVYWLFARSAPASPAASTQAATAEENAYAPEIQRVSLADAKAAFDQKTALFVDVRAADSYQAGHISGAVNIPLGELEGRAGELDSSRWIITYCS
jgi:3-mercaptopyruvate sulfurtransferase SseA